MAIRKRTAANGSVSYQITVEGVRDPLTGKRDRHYKTVRGTRKQAEAIERKMITALEGGNVLDASAIRLTDWMLNHLENYSPNLAVNTRYGNRLEIQNHIAPTIGKIPLKSLKADDIQKWVNSKSRDGLSPKTIHNMFIRLKTALKKAVQLRMLPFNPCEGVELPKLVRYQGEVYDTTMIRKALELAEGTDMYLIILIQSMLGLRRGELNGLKWEHVDFEAKILHVQENRVRNPGECITKLPKTDAGNRSIFLGDEIVSVLHGAWADYCRERDEMGAAFHDLGYIIHKKNGDPYYPDYLTQKWSRFVKKNGLPQIRLHDLRHSHATALIQMGVTPKVVQHRMGHANVSTTLNTYTHVLTSMDQEAAEKLDSMILG